MEHTVGISKFILLSLYSVLETLCFTPCCGNLVLNVGHCDCCLSGWVSVVLGGLLKLRVDQLDVENLRKFVVLMDWIAEGNIRNDRRVFYVKIDSKEGKFVDWVEREIVVLIVEEGGK